MTDRFAFIGDVHGNLDALHGILDVLGSYEGLHSIFLGDYINKGPKPAAVLELLLTKQVAGEVTLLAGNHETVLLKAFDTSDLTAFLKMGGATTIRSYLHRPVCPNVLADFRAHLPDSHLAGLKAMPLVWETEEVFARHISTNGVDTRFSISAHVPVGLLPRVTTTSAQLDTGCGSNGNGGRLTAFLWPSRQYLQVDAAGRQVL